MAFNGGEKMWEIDSYNWAALPSFRDSTQIPELLTVVLNSQDTEQWSAALLSLESSGSDLGVPCAATPALVSCLVSMIVRIDGQKRSGVLSLLEEFTCGRGADLYSETERIWLRNSVYELTLALKELVELMERSSVEDARNCVDLLAYCAEHSRELADRVRRYFAFCQARYPALEDEIAAVSAYFAEKAAPEDPLEDGLGE